MNIAVLGTDVSHKPKVSLKRSGTISGQGKDSASSASRTAASAASPNVGLERKNHPRMVFCGGDVVLQFDLVAGAHNHPKFLLACSV